MKPNKETYRILVIDDHPIVAEGIIALASQLEGVTCKGATCAKDVEQLTLKERFDLCIIDLELPDMNGFQLISHLHSRTPECGILIYTMHEEPWIIAKLSTLNINGAVSKNASTSELRDAISTLKNEPDTSAMFSANWTRKNKTPYHMRFPNCRDVKKKCSPISRKD